MMTVASLTAAAQAQLAQHDDPNVVNACGSSPGQTACGQTVESFLNQIKKGSLPALPCGASEKEWRQANDKRLKAVKSAVMRDVADQNGISRFKLGIYMAAGAVVFLIGGPIALVLVAAEATLGYCLEQWMDNHDAVKSAADGMP